MWLSVKMRPKFEHLLIDMKYELNLYSEVQIRRVELKSQFGREERAGAPSLKKINKWDKIR